MPLRIQLLMRPPLRLVHHLAKSGGTLISRCLGCMQNLVLLSEVHPLDSDKLGLIPHPLLQAHVWFNLFTTEQIREWETQGFPSFAEAIALVEQRVVEQEKILVLRDWNHLDCLGQPFWEPTQVLSTKKCLESQFDCREIATVRHPIDQWCSMQNIPALKHISLESYLTGYWDFLRACGEEMAIFRYEDFCQDPEKIMLLMCESLSIPYDANFIDKWMDYTCITGDTGNFHHTAIRAKIYPRSPELLQKFNDNPDYANVRDYLGYDENGVKVAT